MTIHINEVKCALMALKDQSGNVPKSMINFIDTLTTIVTTAEANNRNTIELIDRKAMIATVLWDEEDLRTGLNEHDWADTKRNLNAVLSELSPEAMCDGMIETGWDYIDAAIATCERNKTLI